MAHTDFPLLTFIRRMPQPGYCDDCPEEEGRKTVYEIDGVGGRTSPVRSFLCGYHTVELCNAVGLNDYPGDSFFDT